MIKVKLRPEQGIKVKTTPAQSPDVKLKTVYLYDADWIPEINKAVEEANESAESAKTSAESAEASANSAAESARNADADADNASESAGLAAQEAQKAIDAATTATQEADAAAESAYQAQLSALAAAEYAQNASSDAENAVESLEHVLISLAQVKTSEQNAKESETKAKASETTATQEANASAESAYQSQQSALAASEYASNAEADASNVRETLDLVLDAETAATNAAQTATEKAQQATDGANIATQKAGVSTEQANIATEKADEASQFALECQEIKNSLGSVYKFKGSVNTFDDLPTVGNEVGDVYNIIDTDKNYAWDGEKWDDIGGTVDLSDYALKTELPTKTSELENDSGFITDQQVYRSLSEEKKSVLVNEGTYDGNEVSDGEIFTEYDGKFVEFKNEPTEGKPPVQVTQPIAGSVFGHGGRVIIWSTGTTGYYSDNSGSTWNTFTIPFAEATKFAHNGSLWMAASSFYTATSSDGITWSQGAGFPSRYASYLGSFKGKFYTYYQSSFWYSEDGSSWTQGTSPVSGDIVLLCRDEDIIIFGADGDIYKTTDVVSWEALGVSLGTSDWYQVYAKAYYVLGKTVLKHSFGGSGAVKYSTNLTDWTTIAAQPYDTTSIVEVNDSLAISTNMSSLTKSEFYKTTDGVSWTTVTTPSSFTYCLAAATNDGTFYIFQQRSTTGFIGKAGNAFSLKELSYNKSEVEALISEETSPLATKEYVDTTEQEIIENFMDADTALQTQITGLSGVLAEEQNKIEAIEGKIPTNASSSNLLSTASDLLNATQDVRADFAEADSELQTQINGQATAIAGKQEKLTAGENIQIDGNVISSTGGGSEEDNITITKTGEGKIQAVAVIDSNASYPIKIWTGTKEEYDAIGTKDNNTIYNVTDDIKDRNENDYIIEYKKPTSEDNTWYRAYRSGWIEQGGIAQGTITSGNAIFTIQFIKQFSVLPVITAKYLATQGNGYEVLSDARVDGFTFAARSASGNFQNNNKGLMWTACGLGG